MAVHFHEEDLPPEVEFADGPIAVDTEAMGLVPGRDRLCLVQLSDGKGDEHLVRFSQGSDYSAPNLKALLGDSNRLKLYHFARFDVGIMQAYLGILAAPLYCTRTASRLIRTYTDRHGLKDLVKELLNIDLSKQQQTSDWGAAELSATRSANMRRATSAISTSSRRSSMSGSNAKTGWRSPRPASIFFRRARCSISPAGPSRTFSRMMAEVATCLKPPAASATSSSAGRCREALTIGSSAGRRSCCRARSGS